MNDLKVLVQMVLDWLNSFFGVKTSQQRYQVIDVTVPSGLAAAQLREFSVQLDRAFNKIVGIAYHPIAEGTAALNYNVGAKTNRQTWVDLVNVSSWQANTGVGPMQKFRKVNIPYGNGDTFYAQIQNNALLASDLTGQMVLILERDNTELPR
jgi:hypothetical protein